MARRGRGQSKLHSVVGFSVVVLKILLWVGLGFVVISVTVVMSLRWIDPLSSGIQIQRRFEAEGEWQARHQWVPWESIAPAMALAVIAAEDQRFLQHSGFDTVEIQKAIAAGQQGERLRGASTISQQTAKNVFLWNGRSFVRKGLEAWFTILIELCWSKQRILEVYLNSIEFGTGIFGVEAASQQFFGKPAKRLQNYEAAILAAVLPNPHRMFADRPSAYVYERQRWIMNQMRQLGGEEIIKGASLGRAQ